MRPGIWPHLIDACRSVLWQVQSCIRTLWVQGAIGRIQGNIGSQSCCGNNCGHSHSDKNTLVLHCGLLYLYLAIFELQVEN